MLVRNNTRASQPSKRARRKLSLAETRDTSRLRCRQQKRLTDKSGTCDLVEAGASTRLSRIAPNVPG